MQNEGINYIELQKELDLAKSKLDFYKTVLDHSVDWEILQKPSGEFLYCSPSCKQITGYEAQEFLENPDLFLQIIHPEDRELFLKHLNLKRKELEGEIKIEFRIIAKDGQEKWIEHLCKKAYNSQGELIGYRSSNRIIPDRKKMVDSLIDSEALNKALLGATPDLMFVIDNNGIILDYSASNKKVLYTQPENFLQKNVKEVLPPYLAEQTISKIKKVLETQEIQIFTYQLNINNQIRYYESRVVPYGEYKTLSIVRDVTESIIAEEKLRESEAILRAIMEGTADNIWAFNRNYEIIYINPTFQNDFYQSFGIKLIKGSNLLDSLPNSLQPIWKQRYNRALANEQFTIEDAVETKIGTIYIEVTFNPIVNNGEVIGCSCFARNITERKNAEKEIIAAKERAEESDRLKSAFLANMSHEIRTPMNGILGFAQLLKEPNLPEEEKLEYVEMIEKSGERMLNILNDLIDISKIEAGVVKVNNQATNINEKIRFIYNFFELEAENRALEFSCKFGLPDELAIINTDSDKLYAIITNLIKNSLKFTESGSIEFGYIANDDELRFFVKDTGIGISKDKQQVIFERFMQADIEDKMARQGAGLGLAIAKAYVEMLGGKIWVESDEGVGSTFYFTLPYQYNLDNNNFENNTDSVMKEDENIKLKILVVEDDPTSQKLLKKILERYTKEIIFAYNGQDAVEICRQNSDLDLILMDMRIPILTGFEATRKIREFNQEVIIIAQTAFGLAGDREKTIQAGCNDYISKPLNREKLIELINKYFGQRNLY